VDREIYWHPVTRLSFAGQFAMGFSSASASHFINVLIHGFAVVVMAGVLRWWLGVGWGWAAWGALAWGLHPLRVESVVWVAERKDVLSGLFGGLALLCYLRAVREPNLHKIGLCFGFGVLAYSGACRSRFRGEGDHRSGVKAIAIPG
jgi:hypothetical protein